MGFPVGRSAYTWLWISMKFTLGNHLGFPYLFSLESLISFRASVKNRRVFFSFLTIFLASIECRSRFFCLLICEASLANLAIFSLGWCLLCLCLCMIDMASVCGRNMLIIATRQTATNSFLGKPVTKHKNVHKFHHSDKKLDRSIWMLIKLFIDNCYHYMPLGAYHELTSEIWLCLSYCCQKKWVITCKKKWTCLNGFQFHNIRALNVLWLQSYKYFHNIL